VKGGIGGAAYRSTSVSGTTGGGITGNALFPQYGGDGGDGGGAANGGGSTAPTAGNWPGGGGGGSAASTLSVPATVFAGGSGASGYVLIVTFCGTTS
jgi:hypothetical protein